jgi:uncharacterized protein (TIGR02147 family)
MWQKEFGDLLGQQFRFYKQKNSKFSVRAYAKKIGLSAGCVSDILLEKKKWNLTPKRAAKILDRLNISSSVRNRLLVKMGEPPILSKKTLSVGDYDILTDWVYYPILFSFDLKRELCHPEKIALRLGVSLEKVVTVIDDLLKRGLVVMAEDGLPKRPEGRIETSDGIPSEVIRKSHEVNLELCQKALAEQPVNKRDFTAMTFAGTEAQIAELRAEIRKLYEKAESLMSSDNQNDSVFRLSVQLFPMEFEPK